tara:strand:- start:479 stop:1729 length:1251 start_codon:yes stop_codon:yes gene_type:complete
MRTTIDLFAGAGGASIGLRDAGFHHELCIEWDEDAASTLVAAGLPGIHGDVRELGHYDNLEHVDLMWASPPCQAFSIAGERKGALDDRNGWPWTLDVIDHLQSSGIGPEYVVCENVPGLTYHTSDCDRSDYTKCSGCYWEAWVQPEFKKRFDWVGTMMLNAADFGVPQFRRRVFLVAGPRSIQWPQKTHCSKDKVDQQTMFGPVMKPWVSISEALGIDRKIVGGGRNPTPDPNDKRTYRDITDEPSTTVAAVQIGNAGPFILTEEQKAEKKRYGRWLADGSDVDGPCRTIGTKNNRYLYENGKDMVVSETLGTGVPGSEPWRMEVPSPTVTCRDYKGPRHLKFDPTRGPMTAPDALWRGIARRKLTWRECAKLQGFPDDHPFQGKTQVSMYKQAGNAVCPIVSEVLGRCVLQAMGS